MLKTNNAGAIHAIAPILLVVSVAALAPGKAVAQFPEAGGQAKAPPQPAWIYPVIAKFGGVHPRADAAVRPDPKVNYKIFVDVISDERNPAGQYEALIRLARLVNLMAYAKVPPEHVHIVALLDGMTGWAAATDAIYQQQYKANNPNLPIVHALKKAGVRLLVCSQALAEHDLPDSAVDPDVTISLSALTDPVVYGQKGYIYMRL